MMSKRGWFEKLHGVAASKIAQIENQSDKASIWPQKHVFLKSLTWKKCLIILLAIPWCLFAVFLGLCYVVEHSALFPQSVTIRITNKHRKPLWISYVGIDGRRLSDQFGSYEQGLGEIGDKGIPNTARLITGNSFEWELQSGAITPNISHRLTLYISSPPDAPRRVYRCEVIVPRSYGMLLINLGKSDRVSCDYDVFEHISLWD